MRYLLLTICFLYSLPGNALEEIYQSPAEFIQQSFDSDKHPEQKTLWLNNPLKTDINEILGHNYHKLRIRYWLLDNRSAWVLEEIGKDHYITVGFVVDDSSLDRVKVLVFRESRGWEIKYDYFSKQFANAKLSSNSKLDKHIDNITGATLSVNAVKRLAHMALFLDKHINKDHEPTASP